MPIIRVIDQESDGMEPPAAVIEFGACDLVQTPNGWDVVPRGSSLHYGPVKLDPAARAVHHIRPVDLAGQPPFDPEAVMAQAVADDVIIFAAHAWDLAEGRWLAKHLPPTIRPLCTYKAALRVWPDAPSHSNGALRYWLEDQDLIRPQHALTQPAHRAGPDAYVTAWLLKALLEHETARTMCMWTKLPALLPRCPIGDHRGKPWKDVPAGFLKWMIDKPVEPDLVWNAQQEFARREADQRPTEEAV